MAHGHQLRKGRISIEGSIYLITCVCWQRTPHFYDFNYARCVVQGLKGSANMAETLSFVVMPDHIHWLIKLKSGADISRAVQKMKSLSSRLIHSVQSHPVPIWQKGFYDRQLRREEDLLGMARFSGQSFEGWAG